MKGERMSSKYDGQQWQRDGEGPCISLGPPGAFDDAHLFAPCVAFDGNVYRMWYCGSRGTVAGRVFQMGLATSEDGIHFEKYPDSPVFAFGDGRHSILTPAVLRHADGAVCREDGCFRMWFSACDFPSGDGLHTLHETRSSDGIHWSPPSPAQLRDVYSPTLILENGTYRMWYADVSKDPWCLRYAESRDGSRWEVAAEPVITLDQAWEHGRLFYPAVIAENGQYLMWYGSYTQEAGMEMKTALGCAVSRDGRHWQKMDCNPVFGPDASRDWESNFTTSQSLLRQPDGTLRIWYASRPCPPFVHKYFAIGTAHRVG